MLELVFKIFKPMEAIELLSNIKEMPSVISNAKSLEHRFLPFAKESNLDRIKQVLEIYTSKKCEFFVGPELGDGIIITEHLWKEWRGKGR